MNNKIVISIDDSFTPTSVDIVQGIKKMTFCVGDGVSSDNGGGGGRITMHEGEKQMTMYLPKSAVLAVREVFRNSKN